MYKYSKGRKTTLEVNDSLEGESIEMKVRRITENKEPIKDGAPEIFTERKEGVNSAYNIRTDRWEVAVDAMDAVNKSILAKRDYKPKMDVIKNENQTEQKGDAKGESTQGKTQ